jgi:ribonucleoside-diphosphate reductase alpha chain
LEKENLSGYNCAYTTLGCWEAFAETMYILMCGTGVGVSVEGKYVFQLPPVPAALEETPYCIVVEDSREGWAKGYLELLQVLSSGRIPKWDMSKVRPRGARLATFGGRASGPEPLDRLFHFAVKVFQGAVGRKLKPIECYDLVTMSAESVMVGGVRRSAVITLSDPQDREMRAAKDGFYWESNPQRALSNNSAVFEVEGLDVPMYFEKEWNHLVMSDSGERGILDRGSFWKTIPSRREYREFGVNPCGEIILRDCELCNLSEVVVRPSDTLGTLIGKVRAAVLLGVLQSTLTDFQFVRPTWAANGIEERLLGVSLTGLRDHPVLGKVSSAGEKTLRYLRDHAFMYASEFSKALGINVPAAITCVKPSGTVSQLVNCASGLHVRYSPYYIRRVRQAARDPVTALLIASGVPHHPEVGQDPSAPETVVFDFPVKSPKGSVVRGSDSAIDQLEYVKFIKTSWCEHNASNTIYVKPEEWDEVGEWVKKNMQVISGVTFLPYNGGHYELAPYEEISESEYNKRVAEFPKIDFNELTRYETEDETVGEYTYACTGDKCEV